MMTFSTQDTQTNRKDIEFINNIIMYFQNYMRVKENYGRVAKNKNKRRDVIIAILEELYAYVGITYSDEQLCDLINERQLHFINAKKISLVDGTAKADFQCMMDNINALLTKMQPSAMPFLGKKNIDFKDALIKLIEKDVNEVIAFLEMKRKKTQELSSADQQTPTQPSKIEELPVDILAEIVKHTDSTTQVLLASASKLSKSKADSEIAWKDKVIALLKLNEVSQENLTKLTAFEFEKNNRLPPDLLSALQAACPPAKLDALSSFKGIFKEISKYLNLETDVSYIVYSESALVSDYNNRDIISYDPIRFLNQEIMTCFLSNHTIYAKRRGIFPSLATASEVSMGFQGMLQNHYILEIEMPYKELRAAFESTQNKPDYKKILRHITRVHPYPERGQPPTAAVSVMLLNDMFVQEAEQPKPMPGNKMLPPRR